MSYETLFREVKTTFPQPVSEGIALELTSVLSPTFHLSHAFRFASAQQPSSYALSTLVSLQNTLLHAQIDDQAALAAKIHHTWSAEGKEAPFAFTPANRTRLEAQINAQQSAFVLEHEVSGNDYALLLRAINPNPIAPAAAYLAAQKKAVSTHTGMFSVSYMQRIFQGLSMGAEFSYARPSAEVRDPSLSFAARYAPVSDVALPQPPALPAGVASPFPQPPVSEPQEAWTAMYTPNSGLLHASYWRRLNTRLELATECQALITPLSAGGRREGIATVGFRCQTLFANIKSQIDTTGKIVSAIDYALAPGLHFSLAAEMDYSKGDGGQGKMGFGFNMEA